MAEEDVTRGTMSAGPGPRPLSAAPLCGDGAWGPPGRGQDGRCPRAPIPAAEIPTLCRCHPPNTHIGFFPPSKLPYPSTMLSLCFVKQRRNPEERRGKAVPVPEKLALGVKGGVLLH